MISVAHLVRRFGSFTAVDDISFSLDKGEVVGFLGPNGAGKSTTMRMLTGFLPATRGSIQVAGFDVIEESLEVRRRIGYLPEAVPLYREHRVEEMLLFQGRLHGLTRKEARRRGADVLARVGLADRARSVIGKLSKGQRQRIGLAVALLPDPEVLILDEPTSGLDPLQRIEVRSLIRELAQDRTVLLSSHILPEVEAVCPRVIVLHQGSIVADGTSERLVSQLGGATYVAVEAVVPDAEEAVRLLGSLPGASEVEDDGRLGIHRRFRVLAAEDLREDVGALAAQKGWALRELSWHQPTLEQLFARVALGLDPEGVEDAASEAPAAPAPPNSGPALQVELDLAASANDSFPGAPAAAPAPGPPATSAPMLNPFQVPAPGEELPRTDAEGER